MPSVVPRPVILQAFCPPPFRDADQEKLNCVCPVEEIRPTLCVLWCFVCFVSFPVAQLVEHGASKRQDHGFDSQGKQVTIT